MIGREGLRQGGVLEGIHRDKSEGEDCPVAKEFDVSCKS